MKKLTLLLTICLICVLHQAKAQNIVTEPEDSRYSFSVGLHQDVFFGFYPTLAGSYALDNNLDLSFYGIIWTHPGFSAGSHGIGLWTEFGAGLNFNLMEDQLSINPQIGITNGSLLSSYLTERPVMGDGIVPNLTAGLDTELFEGEFYGGYYLALRKIGPVTTDYLHYWINGGVKLGKVFSAGAHYEHLVQTRLTEGEGGDVYQWIGPYVQFALPNSCALRFSGGPDVVASEDARDFYKLSFSMNF